MYCVIANIDSKFCNLQEAQAVYNTFTPVIPAPPEVRDPMKDVTKPRTLVACIVEHCVTALGIRHTFFRCTSFDDKIPSCATEGLEVYPVVVLTFLTRSCIISLSSRKYLIVIYLMKCG